MLLGYSPKELFSSLLDLDLDSGAVGLSVQELLAEVQRVLVGSMAERRLECRIFDPADAVDHPTLTAIGEIWLALASTYEHRLPSAAAAIRSDLKALEEKTTPYSGKHGVS